MRSILVVAAVLFSLETAQAQLCECTDLAGWQQGGHARTYVSDNLFEYKDGAAEGYFVFQFVRMQGITCVSGEDSIAIDVSEMADPELAYGIFAANCDSRQPIEPIGMGGQVFAERALFAKGKYFVELTAIPMKDHSAALRAFVKALEKRITEQSKPPEIIAWFPKENLVPGSVRLVPQSVLGLRILRRGYVAEYDFGKGFLVPEATPEAASALMGKLRERMGQTQGVTLADEAFTATDKYLDGMVVFRKGRYVGGFANLKSGRNVSAEASRLAANISKQ